MHWFDRMSKQFAAVPPETTRRSVLRGTAVAAVVAPFAPGALAHANRWLRGSASEEACAGCLSSAAEDLAENTMRCLRKPGKGKAQRLSKGNGGKAARKGVKAAEAAKQLQCVSTAAAIYTFERQNCTKRECRGSHSPTAPPNTHPGEEGGSGCPSGTTFCSGTLCCYGSDQCCACAAVDGGVICCAAVIQCTCC